jgi:hypothetical protein
MSTTAHALAAAGIAASAVAALTLWLAARRRSGRARLGYLGQGYLVAGPMSAGELESMIRTTLAQPAHGAVPPEPGAESEAVVSLSETGMCRS